MPLPLLLVSLSILSVLSLLGFRLLVTGVIRRSIPELALAAFFLVGGSMVFGFELAGREFLSESSEWQTRLKIGSNLASRVPAVSIALFTWRVFRPGERWAASIFVLIAGSSLALTLNQLALGHPTLVGGTSFWIGVVTIGASLAWAMADSFRYYLRGLRKVAIGLADPFITNRFLLWSLWSGTAMMIVVGKVTAALLFDASNSFTSLRIAISLWQSSMGLTCVITMGLTFYPPPAYKRWIESRSPRQSAES